MADRLQASWAGLDDAAWRLPGAAPSDAGGPDWSLAEHVGHIAEWLEVATAYTAHAAATDEWPADSDFEDGDFDRWNEAHRAPWSTMSRDDIVGALRAGPRRDARPGPAAARGPDPRRRTVGLGVHGPPRALPRPPRDHRVVDGHAPRPPDRRRSVRALTLARRIMPTSSPVTRPSPVTSTRWSGPSPRTAGWAKR